MLAATELVAFAIALGAITASAQSNIRDLFPCEADSPEAVAAAAAAVVANNATATNPPEGKIALDGIANWRFSDTQQCLGAHITAEGIVLPYPEITEGECAPASNEEQLWTSKGNQFMTTLRGVPFCLDTADSTAATADSMGTLYVLPCTDVNEAMGQWFLPRPVVNCGEILCPWVIEHVPSQQCLQGPVSGEEGGAGRVQLAVCDQASTAQHFYKND